MTETGDVNERRTEEDTQKAVSFSVEGLSCGFVRALPIALGVGGYGTLFGVLARQAGLSISEAALMSATVLAGAAQLIAVEMWDSPVPVIAILATTTVVNLRYILMGAALRPWFKQLTPIQAYGSVFFTADENWALTMKEFYDGREQGAFLLGSGLAIWTFWVAATIIGATAGHFITDPASYGLDFILTAVFLTLVVGFWDGTETLLPWSLAALVAIVSAISLPGQWYILLGGLTASATVMIRSD